MKNKIILVIMFAILLTGCSKKEKNEINVLNWSSYIPDSIIRDFEKSTNIKVNYSTYSSNEELLAKVSNSNEGTYDIIFPSDYMVELMINRGMLEKLDKTKIQNYENINEDYMNYEFDKGNKYSLPFLSATTVIAYNKENIKENISSYNDLLNPKYKNNIVLIDDQRNVIGGALLACGYDMNSTNEKELKEAEKWLFKLKNNIKAYDSDSPKNFLISKEVDIALIWNAEAALAYEENQNIEVVYPEEGIAKSLDNFAIPKGGKNRENVYKFIDYILKPEVMKQIVESYPYKNVNIKTDRILSDNYLLNKAANINSETINNGYFVKNIGSYIKNYDKLWANIK